MKKIQLLTAGMVAMLAINAASAQVGGTLPQVEIRYTGSTAFRKATVNSIQNSLVAGYVWGSSNGGGLGANQQIFVGTTKTSGITVVIKTAWAGSAGGIVVLAENIPAAQPFVNDNLTNVTSYAVPAATVNGIALTNAGANIPLSDITESHTADVALSDAFASTTPYTGAGFTALHDTVVGVVPFAWVKGAYTPDGTVGSAVPGGYPGVTNVSAVQGQELLGNGGISLNQFTGNPADQAVFVQMVGRDHDSGTRIGYEYDTQYGNFESAMLQLIPNGATINGLAAPFSNPPIFTQFEPQTAGSGVITELDPWPVETVVGETRSAGNEGFFTGGTIATVLTRPVATNDGNYTMSWLGFGDSPNVNPGAGYSYTDGAGNVSTITPSQNACTFDGYYPGTAAHPFGPTNNINGSGISGYSNIIQGVYTGWGYEHYLYAAALGAGNEKTVADQIAVQLTSEADFGGVGQLLSVMNSSRVADGANVTSP